jgi:hypothetical protein
MHILAISLLTILAGTLLLAKFRKELAGKFFLFISWFFIAVGFLLFAGFIAGGICKLKNGDFPGRPGFRHEMRMKGPGPGMPGRFCCPPGMHRRMMDKKPCCTMQDSTMKCCMPKDSLAKCCPGK